jgi:hypothetical protein
MFIFQELCAANEDIIQFIPFVYAFYTFEYLMFYSHHNRDDNVLIIPSIIGTCQNDLFKKALFALTHFKALHFLINNFPSCSFPFITNDTHIIGAPSIVSSEYEHFETKFHAISLFIQLQKYVTWSPSCVPPNFDTPS